MLGCEHAFIAAGALMAALKNSPYGKGKITDADIREVFDQDREAGRERLLRAHGCVRHCAGHRSVLLPLSRFALRRPMRSRRSPWMR